MTLFLLHVSFGVTPKSHSASERTFTLSNLSLLSIFREQRDSTCFCKFLNLHSNDWSVEKKKKETIFCNLVYSGPAITSLLFDISSIDHVSVTF